MRGISVSIAISAPVEVVWERLSDLASHSEWMTDAASILFLTDQRRGVGVGMRVPTRGGPCGLSTSWKWTSGPNCSESVFDTSAGSAAGDGSNWPVTGTGASLPEESNFTFPGTWAESSPNGLPAPFSADYFGPIWPASGSGWKGGLGQWVERGPEPEA